MTTGTLADRNYGGLDKLNHSLLIHTGTIQFGAGTVTITSMHILARLEHRHNALWTWPWSINICIPCSSWHDWHTEIERLKSKGSPQKLWRHNSMQKPKISDQHTLNLCHALSGGLASCMHNGSMQSEGSGLFHQMKTSCMWHTGTSESEY